MSTELDGSAVKEIERLAKDSLRATTFEVKGERAGVYYLVGPDGKTDKKVSDPGWHKETIATPQELRRFIDVNKSIEGGSVVFLNENEAVFVRELDDRRDISTCKLTWTPQYKWLAQESGKQLAQPDLIRVLRIVLRGALPSDSTLLGLIRKLKFQNDQNGSGDIQHGRESLGKSIIASINADHQLPEEITFRVPIFENHPFVAAVVCAIEIFPHESCFKLTPYPLELRKAMDAALDNVAQTLDGDDRPAVYMGQP